MPTGIISLSQQFMKLMEWPEAKKKETMNYLNFLAMRARGKLPTGARFIRDFVMSHPDYKQDSYVSPETQYDLMKMIDSLDSPDSAAKSILLKDFA